MDDDRESELALLRRRAMATGGGLIAIILATGATCLLLIDSPRSADLRRLAVVSVAAGALGASLGALSDVLTQLRMSFDDQRRVARGRTPAAEREVERELEQMNRDELRASPLLLTSPLIGGALGLVLFAGVVGGFLVANPSSSGGYSFPGLIFLAFLAGFFARNFITRLQAAAEALFGPDPAAAVPDKRQERTDHSG